MIKHTDPALLIGSGNLAAGVAVCMLRAGHRLDVYTEGEDEFFHLLGLNIDSQKARTGKIVDLENLTVYTSLPAGHAYQLAIVLTEEDLEIKRQIISRLTKTLAPGTLIAINTDSFPLDAITDQHQAPGVLGLNWAEPAHTTFFLEIIAGRNNAELADELCILAKTYWQKDPYIVIGEGIRGRLLSAMAREAAFLVDNGYATVDDIDRACRNDAGYYLPFSGNCRYMDLMGTFAYGMVMKDLNPELSKDTALPAFFKQILETDGLGMKNKKGFYPYSDESVDNWKKTMEEFSYKIQAVIEKYPFNYQKEPFID